ncbi:hypothetical protein C9374_013361 [Naegleria lovaniensis]|uniref:Biogenesis of lysosome-related organelles complex 1 subunit 2 n=1 Tax=Naegleria lovaniensis TaxID=51637 RepID=A0AA88H0F6_NAELO|nr:uncharacterized protein C9374_013361 [Naegleria lovaniensis]KAG2391876.1 hypothetical protein C9374_013361 [Naegleria lovaniensis]
MISNESSLSPAEASSLPSEASTNQSSQVLLESDQHPQESSRTRSSSLLATYRERSASSASSENVQSSSNQQHRLEDLTEKMFENFIELLQGEMQAGFNELSLLQQMNAAITKKYEGLNQKTEGVHANLKKMMQLYESLQTCFQEVDSIDISVNELNNIVNYLDVYTKQLELQLKPFL